jgi:hypothetical protein
MSTNRGDAPTLRMAFNVAPNVKGVVITSSPGPTPFAINAAVSALVPLFTATAWRVPATSATAASNRSTIGP